MPLDFKFQANQKSGRFLPLSASTMQLTYWSIVLLACIIFDWDLLTSAEEGESGASLEMLPTL